MLQSVAGTENWDWYCGLRFLALVGGSVKVVRGGPTLNPKP